MKNIAIMSLSILWAIVPLLAGCSTIHKSADQGDLQFVVRYIAYGGMQLGLEVGVNLNASVLALLQEGFKFLQYVQRLRLLRLECT